MSRVVILCRPTWLRIHCCKIQITCLRVAKYGGGGNKVGATKPHGEMPFHPFQSTPNDKRPASAPRRASFANGKENRRAVSAGKSFIARPKLEGNSAAIAGVRLSTSSFPRGKPSEPSDMASELRGKRRLPRVSTSGQLGIASGRDPEAQAGGRRSFGGIRVSDTFLPGKGLCDQSLKKNAERLDTFLRNPEPKGDAESLDLIAEKLGRKNGDDSNSNAKGSSSSSKPKKEAPLLEKKARSLKESASLQTSKRAFLSQVQTPSIQRSQKLFPVD
ncbi:hypothetical protein ZIOFF_029922 [Zingiber officinale]|uniref:Uncharacterized protein n=1 Tax=Zingiber officinale TaxID=94328 RepID=A0A8J5LB89_ZINOF|nr:hypothetical protein ZIOFF_029922 [Zingiber officinale]